MESYLDKHGRSAEGLIAGLVGTRDPAWLREAVEKYPGNLLENLSGIRLQERLLQGIDADSPYGASGLTVRDQLASLAQREQSLVEAGQQTLCPEDRADGRLWFPPMAGAQGPR